MEILIPILQHIATLLFGGGLTWLIFYRQNKKLKVNEVSVSTMNVESQKVEHNESLMKKIEELMAKVVSVGEVNMQLKSELHNQKMTTDQDMHKLKSIIFKMWVNADDQTKSSVEPMMNGLKAEIEAYEKLHNGK